MRDLLIAAAMLVTTHAHAQFNGVPFADDTARCQYVTDQVTAEQQRVIAATVGQHMHRLYHWLWHASRGGWSSLTPEQRQSMQAISPEWGRHAPLCPAPTRANGNPAGEEFLRMHHQMIDFVRGQLVANGLPCITGWTTIPRAGDPLWPVPAGMPSDSSKAAEMERLLQAWSTTFMDHGFLRSRTLSEIGFLVEFSIHNNLHMRFARLPLPGDDFSPMNGSAIMMNSDFAGPRYDYLGNPYSSAVSPLFWKLHGWVDNVIVEWLRANGFDSIADDCGGRANCYQWRSRWIGGMEHAGHAPGEPIGGGFPGASKGPAIEASFRNKAFDEFLNEPRGGAGEDQKGGDEFTALEDPAEFVRRFGPCSRLPSFLR